MVLGTADRWRSLTFTLVARLRNMAAFGRRCIPPPPQRAGKRALGAPGLAALLAAQIFPIFSRLAPCQAGASPPSVRRHIYETDHLTGLGSEAHTASLRGSMQRLTPCAAELSADRVDGKVDKSMAPETAGV